MKVLKNALLTLTVLASATTALAGPEADRLLRSYDLRTSTSTSSISMSRGEFDVRNWCDTSVRNLERAIRLFENQIRAGRNGQAFQTLKSALEDIMIGSPTGQNEPLVKMSAESALIIAGKLEQKGLSADPAGLNTIEHLVRNTMTVAYPFDRDYYINYVYRHGRHPRHAGASFMESMQRAALNFASGQISAALKSATEFRGEFRPKGDARAFLTAAEVIANNTAYDLESNIFASEIPCTIVQLEELGSDLKAFNGGDRTTFSSAVVAVDEAGHGLSNARASISTIGRCY